MRISFRELILVFSTLKEELSKKEISLLKPLVNRCRRYYKAEEPYNPVMILTKTELFADISMTYAWKDKGVQICPLWGQTFLSKRTTRYL